MVTVLALVAFVALVALTADATLWFDISVMPKPATVVGLLSIFAQLGGGWLNGIYQPSTTTMFALLAMLPIAVIAPVGTYPVTSYEPPAGIFTPVVSVAAVPSRRT